MLISLGFLGHMYPSYQAAFVILATSCISTAALRQSADVWFQGRTTFSHLSPHKVPVLDFPS